MPNFWEQFVSPFKKVGKIISEWLRKKPEDKPMVLEVGVGLESLQKKAIEDKISLMAKEPILKPTLITAPLTEWLKGKWVEMEEREKETEVFKKQYPERYVEIQKLRPAMIGITGAEELIKRGKLTEKEVELFAPIKVGLPVIAGMKMLPGHKLISAPVGKVIQKAIPKLETFSNINPGVKPAKDLYNYLKWTQKNGLIDVKLEDAIIESIKRAGIKKLAAEPTKMAIQIMGNMTRTLATIDKITPIISKQIINKVGMFGPIANELVKKIQMVEIIKSEVKPGTQLEIPGMPKVKIGIPVGKPKEVILKGAKKLELELKQPATKDQIAEAHIIAKKLKLIVETESGKFSFSRYRRLAEGITGKSSIKEMTKAEADDFINAMESVVKRQPWEPPIIPLSTKIVPKEFFEITFKEPGLAKVFTPKEYYQRILGTEPLLKPVVEAKKLAYLEQQNINRWIDNIVKRINKQAGVSMKEKFVATILNKPTDPIVKMRDLLDQYETAPGFLSSEESKLFTEVRDFTKSMLERTNEVRARLGLDPIREVKAYITHYLNELSRQIVQKKYPFPEDVKYWLGRNMPAKIYNPIAMERRVREDLDKIFSKDLGRLLKAMSKYDLRDIYLSEPYSILRAELNALGDRIPASTRKELDAFLRHDIFNYPDELDNMLNKTLEKPTQIINWFIKPFNRVITNPVRSISSVTRRLVFGATIWGRPKLVIRNLFQKILTIDLYPVKNYLRAQFWKTPEGMMDKIRGTTFYKLSRRFEDIPEGIRKIEQAGMTPYQKSHAGFNYLSNVDTAMKVGYYSAEDLVKQSQNTTSRFYKYLQKLAEKDGVPLEKYLWTEEDIIKEAVEAGSLTQWLYYSTDMPWVYRGYTKRAFMTLQSWWQNFFFKHQREAISRMVTGKTSWGKPIPPSWRLNWIKGSAIILGITEGIRRSTGLDYGRFLFLWGPAPAYLSPPGQIVVGLYNFITADNDWKRTKALNQIKYSYKAFIPGSMAWRDLSRFLKGETTLKEFLFYTEKVEEKKPIEIKPIGGKTMEEMFKPTKRILETPILGK